MSAFITANVGTIVVALIVAAVIGFAIYSTVKDKKKGNSCGCGCEGCSHKCH